jgi:hypothetical protein
VTALLKERKQRRDTEAWAGKDLSKVTKIVDSEVTVQPHSFPIPQSSERLTPNESPFL